MISFLFFFVAWPVVLFTMLYISARLFPWPVSGWHIVAMFAFAIAGAIAMSAGQKLGMRVLP